MRAGPFRVFKSKFWVHKSQVRISGFARASSAFLGSQEPDPLFGGHKGRHAAWFTRARSAFLGSQFHCSGLHKSQIRLSGFTSNIEARTSKIERGLLGRLPGGWALMTHLPARAGLPAKAAIHVTRLNVVESYGATIFPEAEQHGWDAMHGICMSAESLSCPPKTSQKLINLLNTLINKTQNLSDGKEGDHTRIQGPWGIDMHYSPKQVPFLQG